MRKLSTYTAAAVLAVGLAGTALAQTTLPAGAEHEGHHPDAPPAAQPPVLPLGAPAAGLAGPSGMMGGDMGRMMQQMMQGRMAAAAMQPFRRIEGQLAFFRAELRITDDQLPQWAAFADAVRAQGDRLRQVTQQAMGGTVRRQRLWDQIGDLNNGGFLAHRNPKESEDEPEILRPTHAGAS